MLGKLFLYLVVVSMLLSSGCLIKGRVVDENDVGLAGVMLTLSGNSPMTVLTDSNGYFQFGKLDNMLPAASYTVTPSASGYSFSPVGKNVTITTGKIDEFGDVSLPVNNIDFKVNWRARYWAVIVGISDYQTISDLNFAAKDATSIYSLLLQDSRWDKSRMTLLLDSKASRSAIESAIETMALKAETEDICLFFFSGHGGQADEDFSPADESDGKDEYLWCWDSNKYNYSGDITDDRMGDLIGLIGGKTVVILDTCSSGGFLKTALKEEDPEGVHKRGKIKFLRKPFEQHAGTTRKGDGFASDLVDKVTVLKDADDQSDIVVLTACDEDETSTDNYEFQHGEFTYFLLLGLKSNDSNGNGHVSAEESFAYLEPALRQFSGSTVTPQKYADASVETDLVQPTSERLVFVGYGDFSWVYPFNTYWKKRRVEYIYTQSQLGGKGEITALKIFADEKPALALLNCTIRMQHTTENSYGSVPQWTSNGWTTVYSGTKTIESEGPVSFVLSTPFSYDGVRNLIIDFSFSNLTPTSYSSGLFWGSGADTYTMIYYYSDDDNYGEPITWSGTSPPPIRGEDPSGSFLDLELEFGNIDTKD